MTQFKVDEVDDPCNQGEKVKRLIYKEHGFKNHQGLVHQVHLDNKIVSHYASPSLGEKCFVSLFELYIGKLPEEAKESGTFYCKPKLKFKSDDTTWYYKTPVGHNILSSKLKSMFVKAKLNTDGVHNHSLRATSLSRMYERGVAEKSIMDRSGHLSLGGVHTYERISEKTKMEVSNLLSNADYKDKEETPLGPLQPNEKANEKFFNMQGCTVNITFNN